MQTLPIVVPTQDAYLHWGIWTGFRALGTAPTGRVVLLVRFASKLSVEDIQQARRQGIVIATPYVGHRFVTVSVSAEDIGPSLECLRAIGAESCELASPSDGSSIDLVPPETAHARLPGGPHTVIGVIDDGCPFAHRGARPTSVQDPRVRSVWDQGGAPNGAPLGYGRIHDVQALTQMLLAATSPFTGTIDEDVAHELSGLPSLRASTSHGAQVLSHAIGYAPAQWPAANAPGRVDVAFVQLPPAALDDPSGAWLNHYALDGIRHVCTMARDWYEVQATTVIVNLSYGPQTGPHDGTSSFERAIGDMVEVAAADGYFLRVVVPSGNAHLGRTHGEFDLGVTPHGGSLDWCVAVDSQASSYLELWLPDQVTVDDLDLTLTAPDGRQLIGRAGSFDAFPDDTAAVVCPPGSQMVMLFVAPTAYGRQVSGSPSFALGLAGRWKVAVMVKTGRVAAGKVHAYLARRDPNMGRQRRGRSGHLDSPTYDSNRFMRESDQLERPSAASAEVVAAGSISGIATGPHTLVVGGNRASDDQPSRYSAGGPSRGARIGPDWSYDADRSRVLQGIASGGNRSATVTRLVGTSVASPQCARELATFPNAKFPPQPGPPPPKGKLERVGSAVRKPRGTLESGQ